MTCALREETLVHVFGVRHLSPAGAWHLRNFLDAVEPDLVLIEGLADADGLVPDIVRAQTRPPIAILAYTDAPPVRTLVYPLARYCPEYQALVWARENRAEVRFIDLPSDIFLALQEPPESAASPPEETSEDDREAEDSPAAKPEPAETPEAAGAPEAPRESLYQRIARQAGETDYETYWERRFEHNLRDDSYRRAAFRFGSGLRDAEEDPPRWLAENLVREAYMRRRICQAIAAGCRPEKIVAVVGAFHAPVLTRELRAMSDEELASLKRRSSKLTLMPYSYFKLSSQSGYGAGNHAPAYFELLWEALERNDLAELPSRYLSSVVRHLRDGGTHRSTAEVIEGVRLARTLSAMKDGAAPTLQDLQDAAITLFGAGERASIRESLARVEVGTAIGQLPKGVSKTSIQDDFDRELDRLKLEKYRTTVKQEMGLDLRENRRAKTPEAAFLDLNRSSFLHRLRLLGIPFAGLVPLNQQAATWAEKWHVQWSPEAEIALVESVLLGETVELAAAFKFKSLLEECAAVDQAAALVRDACQCGMPASMEQARRRLQALSAETGEFPAVAHAANELGMVARYGDVRRFDPSPLLPLVADLFVQGSLALWAAAQCDNDAARKVLVAIDELNKVSLEYHELIDEPLWIEKLQKLSATDDRNPLLSGYACALLLERGMAANDDLAREVSRRLSPGISADLGAGWFEGLAKRNRYALLARQPLWEQLADYIGSLDEEQFRRAVVFLRRAFGDFSPQEKRHIAENLGEHWGVSGDLSSEMLEQPLTEEEEQKLQDLNQFDFGDL